MFVTVENFIEEYREETKLTQKLSEIIRRTIGGVCETINDGKAVCNGVPII